MGSHPGGFGLNNTWFQCPREVDRANRGTGVTPLDACGG